VGPGDRVALWLPNGVPWVNAYVGIAMAGAVCVPVSTRLIEREVAYILTHSDSHVLVTATTLLSRDYAAEARELAKKQLEITVVPIDAERGQLPAGPSHQSLRSCGPQDAAIVQYTSGTTGFPKSGITDIISQKNDASQLAAGLPCRARQKCRRRQAG
jgi:acyl-CoA synthetase (AMP-forming)/AMP-acid ligase II